MTGVVANIKVCNPLKLSCGLTGKYHALCHYTYNLPLPASNEQRDMITENLKKEKHRGDI